MCMPYEKTKEEIELKFIKAGIEQLNDILRPEEPISYDLEEAHIIITKSRATLNVLNAQLKIMEGDNNNG